ncbi:hypothetical protein FHR83_004652 [Actinoplanes campanulatus]|uniref:Uncharacterized protein n=1 Tax=Actinoplanes campanulatus TaxID=113559 RepID=A0A7W5AIM0_9ACTN|nr:hypothetical protein [Actinoplanes campanulatus]MBB3096977.1 hypothetical protein [Actinoplanes campanulatus]
MRRRPLVVLTVALAVLSGCTDDPPTPSAPPPASPATSPGTTLDMPPDSFGPPPPAPTPTGRMEMSPAGYGPFRIGMTQQEVTDAGLVAELSSDGCGSASDFPGTPEVDFWGGELVRVRLTSPTADTVPIGSTLAEVRAAYPAGRSVTGAGGVTGWLVVDGANAMLVEFTAGTATAVTAGVTTTVEEVFAGTRGC